MHYFDAYIRHFEPVRQAHLKRAADAKGAVTAPLKMLEVGVNAGGSIGMWRDYFGALEAFEYHGVDVNADCGRFHRPAEGEHIHVGSQLNRWVVGRGVRGGGLAGR